MSCKFILFVFLLPNILWAQVQFESNGKYGLKLDGKTLYNADYEEIITVDFFTYGRKGDWLYLLSEDKSLSKKSYKKFKFHLLDELLVVGITDENKMDLFDETGRFQYMNDGDYDKIKSSAPYSDTHNSDLLLVLKKGKLGLFNWIEKKEIVPTENDRLNLHDACDKSGRLIFTKQGSANRLYRDTGEEIISFKSISIDDIYPANSCKGYILKRGDKVGFFFKKKSGKYFLIKPIYTDIYFPTDEPSAVVVRSYERFGLYSNYKRILKCKYDKMEVIDGNYIFASATKTNKTLDIDKTINVDREGKILNR